MDTIKRLPDGSYNFDPDPASLPDGPVTIRIETETLHDGSVLVSGLVNGEVVETLKADA